MTKVLIATDLSPRSLNAALYGMELFGRQEASYTLLHCYHYLVANSTSSEEDFGRAAEQAAQRFEASLRAKLPGGSWDIRVVVRPGPLHTVLKTFSEQREPPAVVIMGAEHKVEEGEQSWRNLVIQRSGLPVLVVPPKAYYVGVHNILMADDGAPVQEADLTVFVDLLQRTQARVHMLRMLKEEVLVSANAGRSPLEKALQLLPHNYMHRKGDDLVDVLHEATNDIKADLLVVTHHERSFLQRILHTSASTRMARHAQVPLLCLQQRV